MTGEGSATARSVNKIMWEKRNTLYDHPVKCHGLITNYFPPVPQCTSRAENPAIFPRECWHTVHFEDRAATESGGGVGVGGVVWQY